VVDPAAPEGEDAMSRVPKNVSEKKGGKK